MVLSDILTCICYPCPVTTIYVLENDNEEILFCSFTDDDVFWECEKIMNSKVIEINFYYRSILITLQNVEGLSYEI